MALRERDANDGGGGAAKRARIGAAPAAAPVVEPQELVCPIARELLRDPVVNAAGHTYERVALMSAWAQRGYEGAVRDPLTNAALDTRKLYPNWLARRLVAAFLEQHPGYVPDGWPDRGVPPPLLMSDDEDDAVVEAEDEEEEQQLIAGRDEPVDAPDEGAVLGFDGLGGAAWLRSHRVAILYLDAADDFCPPLTDAENIAQWSCARHRLNDGVAAWTQLEQALDQALQTSVLKALEIVERHVTQYFNGDGAAFLAAVEADEVARSLRGERNARRPLVTYADLYDDGALTADAQHAIALRAYAAFRGLNTE
jgi:hypothetical protein